MAKSPDFGRWAYRRYRGLKKEQGYDDIDFPKWKDLSVLEQENWRQAAFCVLGVMVSTGKFEKKF